MHFQSTTLGLALLVAQALGHGVVTSITGANGVTMPGMSVIDGTPRDCASPLCGAEADTSIIRAGGASPLGRTQGGGAVNAATAVGVFMGTQAPPANPAARLRRGLLSNLLGGGAAGGGSAQNAAGTKTAPNTKESGVAAAAGKGAQSGLPTVGADGIVTMNFHQVNQDGAGPLQAAVDPTSGGTSEAAFQPAQMVQDVPGTQLGSLSPTTTTDFPIKVQMPAGMKCTGTVAGVQNVCVMRVKNSALAGPFGGSVAFTQEQNATAADAGQAAASPSPAAAAAALTKRVFVA